MRLKGTLTCPRCGKRETAMASFCTHCGVPLRGVASLLALLPAILAGGFVALFGQVVERIAWSAPLGMLDPSHPLWWAVIAPAVMLSVGSLLFAYAGAALAVVKVGAASWLRKAGVAVAVGGVACLGPIASTLLVQGWESPWALYQIVGIAALGGIFGAPMLRLARRWAPFSWLGRILSGEPWMTRFAVLFPLGALVLMILPIPMVFVFVSSMVASLFKGSSVSEAIRRPEGQEAAS